MRLTAFLKDVLEFFFLFFSFFFHFSIFISFFLLELPLHASTLLTFLQCQSLVFIPLLVSAEGGAPKLIHVSVEMEPKGKGETKIWEHTYGKGKNCFFYVFLQVGA